MKPINFTKPGRLYLIWNGRQFYLSLWIRSRHIHFRVQRAPLFTHDPKAPTKGWATP